MHNYKIKKYLALIFLIILLLPIQYRFVHVLEYHLPGFEKVHHSSANHNHHNCNHDNEKKGNVFLDQYEDNCPIVSYEFAISDQPKPAVKYQTFTYQSDILQDIKNISCNSFSGTIKQLRAPPLTTMQRQTS